MWTIGIIVAIGILAIGGCFFYRCYRWRKREQREKAYAQKDLNSDPTITKNQYVKHMENIDDAYRHINDPRKNQSPSPSKRTGSN